MAVAVIFGLTLVTVLTLVQVPIMFSLAHSAGEAFLRLFRRGQSSTQDEPVA